MKVTVFLFLLISINCSFSQVEKINLPKGYNFEIRYNENYITRNYNVFITKNGGVNFEGNEVSAKQLGDFLFSKKQNFSKGEDRFLKILLYADVNTCYKFIEAVKSQISSAKISSIYYRTNNLEDISKGLGIRNQASLFYKKEYSAQNNLSDLLTNGIIEKYPIQNLQDILYNQNFIDAELFLNKLKYKKVEFINGDKRIKLSDTEMIFKEIKELDFYFIKSNSKLKYGDYFKSISTIINLYRIENIDI